MNTWVTEKGTKVQLVCSGRSNVYLVSNDRVSFLVDSGMFAALPAVLIGVRNSGAPAPSALVLTHTHFDHAGAAAALRRRFGLKTIVHSHDVKYLGTGDSPFPDGTTKGARALMSLLRRPGELIMRYPPCRTDIRVDELYSMEPFGINAEIIHTPGHSEGSMSVIVDGEIAIVGDAMYAMARKSIVSPFSDDKEQLLESLRKLYDTGAQVFLSGHGPAIMRERVALQIADLERRRERKARKPAKEK